MNNLTKLAKIFNLRHNNFKKTIYRLKILFYKRN